MHRKFLFLVFNHSNPISRKFFLNQKLLSFLVSLVSWAIIYKNNMKVSIFLLYDRLHIKFVTIILDIVIRWNNYTNRELSFILKDSVFFLIICPLLFNWNALSFLIFQFNERFCLWDLLWHNSMVCRS
jgi:hypothetical protein